MNQVAYKTLFSLEGLIFNKIMKLNCASRKYFDTGRVMNLLNVDANGIYGFITLSFFGAVSPILVVISLILIVSEIGVAGLIGPILMIPNTFI